MDRHRQTPHLSALPSDLAPLSWVLPDLGRSLQMVQTAVRRFALEARAGDSCPLDPRTLRQVEEARKCLAQGQVSLTMLGFGVSAKMFSLIDALVGQFLQKPLSCTDDAVRVLEQAGAGTLNMLDVTLRGALASPVALFAQYRALQERLGAARIHPADLWEVSWDWVELDLPAAPTDPEEQKAMRRRMEQSLLRLLHQVEPVAAAQLAQSCASLTKVQGRPDGNAFMALAAGFFDAISCGLLPQDVYVKRTAAQILQYLGKTPAEQSQRVASLGKEVAFFCCFARPRATDKAVFLRMVQKAYPLVKAFPVNYDDAQYGKFEPQQIELLRKRTAALAESWSALAGGDVARLPSVNQQMAMVAESLRNLHPASTALPQALLQASNQVAQSAVAPSPDLAMEVATAVLFVEAAYDTLDLEQHILLERFNVLAGRLQEVCAGQTAAPINDWIAQLYRRNNERQSINNVTSELRTLQDALEDALQTYARNRADLIALNGVPGYLSRMHGVFSILGLDQPALAASRIRSSLTDYLVAGRKSNAIPDVLLEKIANSFGVMSLLIDMLAYQIDLVKALFVYDHDTQELRYRPGGAGKVVALTPQPAPRMRPLPSAASAEPGGPSTPLPPPPPEPDVVVPPELLAVFLVEAAESIAQVLDLLPALSASTHDAAHLVKVRRVFHTIKGSARMVVLPGLSDAAWAFEQLLNVWLAQKRPAKKAFVQLLDQALRSMAQWIDQIAQDAPPSWEANTFKAAADAMRLQDRALPLQAIAPPPAPSAPQDPDTAQQRTPGDAPDALAGASQAHSPQFLDIFLTETTQWTQRLQGIAQAWPSQGPGASSLEAKTLAHSIRGNAATAGYTVLADLAQAIEQALDYLQVSHHDPVRHASVLAQATSALADGLALIAQGGMPQPDAQLLQNLIHIAQSTATPAHSEDPAQGPASATEVQPPAPDAGAQAAPPLPAVKFLPAEVADHIDADLWPIFQEEGAELLQTLGAALRRLQAAPEQAPAKSEVLRTLHTLKGSARLAGAMQLGALSHAMESQLESLDTLDATHLEAILAQFDRIGHDFSALVQSWAQAADVPAPTTPEPNPAPSAPNTVAVRPPLALSKPAKASPGALAKTVRVRIGVLESALDQVGEIMMTRSQLAARAKHMLAASTDLGLTVDRMRSQLRELELQSDLQMQSRPTRSSGAAPAFDPLELDRFTRVQEISRLMAESVADVEALHKGLLVNLQGARDELQEQSRRVRELQRDLLRTRLVPFDHIAERLHGLVRQVAKECDKSATLVIDGGRLEMDRGVLERMVPCLEHLLRNAVVHGIESPDQRKQSAKTAAGGLRISLVQDANDVLLTLADDGAGLNLSSIRDKAIASGLLQAHQQLGEDELAKFLFTPGFSTFDGVSQLAGRGIGLDVVLSEVQALGGRIEVATKSGKGSTFRLVLPLTTAVTQLVMVRIGDFTFGIPSNMVAHVQRLPAAELQAAYAAGQFQGPDGQKAAFFWMGALLHLSAPPDILEGDHHAVLHLRSAGQYLACHVHEVLRNREVVVKNLGRQLVRLPGLAGMTLLPSGATVLIYNPIALAAVYGSSARAIERGLQGQVDMSGVLFRPLVASVASGPQAPLILVVDDAITVRRVIQRTLLRAGYRVALANDGEQALQLLQEERPLLVISDIEMPRMDGFALARNIREHPEYFDLPIVMISSRTAQKHRDHVRSLGVQHYFGKPYSERELMALIRSYHAPEAA